MSGADLVARVRACGSSFYWAIRLLPPDRREAMAALYLFCRAVDDIADGSDPADQKRAALDAWRACLTDTDAAWPDPAVGTALTHARAAFGLPVEPFQAVVDGVAMDLPPGLVAPSLTTLELYCARVAGAVGLSSTRIFGATDPRADGFAIATGHALQLINILRDVAADAAIGRLYLPREALEAAGVPATSPEAALAHPGIATVCGTLAEQADKHYASAIALLRDLPPSDRRALRPAMVMLAVYYDLLHRLRQRGWAPAALHLPPPSASRIGRFAVVLRYRLFDA